MMRQLILLSLVGSLIFSSPVEAVREYNSSKGENFDYARRLASQPSHLEAGPEINNDEELCRQLRIKHYKSLADFYINAPASNFVYHMKLLYSGDVKIRDFIRLAPLWERGVVLGLPSLLAVILFSHFFF